MNPFGIEIIIFVQHGTYQLVRNGKTVSSHDSMMGAELASIDLNTKLWNELASECYKEIIKVDVK